MKKMLAALAGAALMLVLTASGAAAQDDVRIHLIHGIPGVDVDVEVDGSNVFEAFSFQDTQDLSALAGQTLVGVNVKAAGTDDVVIAAGDVTLPSSGNFTIIAHLDADGMPAIAVFENDTSTIAAGSGRIVVRHAAQAPAVDVKANGSVAFSNLANGEEASADLPAGTISAEVVPTGADEPVVIGPADLPVVEGSSLIIYAVGSLDSSIEVLTESISGLAGAPSAVNTGTSPIESDSGSSGLLAVALMAFVAVAGIGVPALRAARN